VDIEIKDNLLISYSALVRFLRGNGSKMEQHVRRIKTSKSLYLGLVESYVSRSAYSLQRTDNTLLRTSMKFTSMLHVSTSTKSSTGRHNTQWHKSTTNYIERWELLSLKCGMAVKLLKCL
jgi:hypothetical protein